MFMKLIETRYSGKNGAHYSAAVVNNGVVYVSGQLSLDPATGKIPEGGIEAETRQALANVQLALDAAGAKREDVFLCRVYTPDVAYWDTINSIYAGFFGSHKPARVIVPCGPLHHGCLVEIEAMANVAN